MEEHIDKQPQQEAEPIFRELGMGVEPAISSMVPENIRSTAKDDDGYNRYSTIRIAQRGNTSYLICTQWTDRHRAAFVRWLRSNYPNNANHQ